MDLDLEKSKALQCPSTYAKLAQLSDEVLMSRLRDGHSDGLAVLFDRYHRLVMTIALRILRDAGEAEDLTQSVFLEIFQSVAQFDATKGSPKAWILQYAYHRSFNRKQHLNLRGLYEHSDECMPAPRTPTASDTRALGLLESARLVEEVLAYVSGRQRRILQLVFYQGLTMYEIAQVTGESFDSVRHHYYRGLDKLRSTLRGQMHPVLQSCSPGANMPNAES